MKKPTSYQLKDLLGLVYIVAGLVLIGFVVGELLIRLVFAALGLWIINYGLQMRGNASLKSSAMRLFFGGFRFR